VSESAPPDPLTGFREGSGEKRDRIERMKRRGEPHQVWKQIKTPLLALDAVSSVCVKELTMEEATTRIQAGIKGMLVRRSIRSETEHDREEHGQTDAEGHPEVQADEQAEEQRDTAVDDAENDGVGGVNVDDREHHKEENVEPPDTVAGDNDDDK